MNTLLNVANIRQHFKNLYELGTFIKDKSGQNVLEIINASFVCSENTIFGIPNEEYIEKELSWYLSQSLNVNDLQDTPKIWKQIADKNGFINSNYGWCIFSIENHEQYAKCLQALIADKDTRRAMMIYTRPAMQEDYNQNGKSDFICTNNVQTFIRGNSLIYTVNMRSNDAWAGYRNDYAWHEYVYNKLFLDLSKKYDSIQKFPIIWNAGSLHIYENQFYLVDHFSKTGEINILKKDYEAKNTKN